MLQTGFRGIPLEFKCIASGASDDGRWLYEIETDSIESRDVIIEGLAAWGAHLKTDVSALELATKLSKRADVSFQNGKVHFPELPDLALGEYYE